MSEPEFPIFPPKLAAKLAAARANVNGVPKKGEAEEGYEFVQAVDVAIEARRVLNEHGILTIPSVKSLDLKIGQIGFVVHAALAFKVVDVDSGQYEWVDWAGAGHDKPGDKALYMAITGGTKYFRAWLLEIPFGVDPEAPSETAEVDALRREQDQAGEPGPELAAVSSA